MAYRADALHAMRDADRMDVNLGDALGGRDMPTADPDEPMNVLVTRMIQTDTSRIPVVRADDGVLIGILARSDVLRVRANVLSEERDRSRILGWGRGGRAA